MITDWEMEHLFHSAILGVLLMIYSDHRATNLGKRSFLMIAHLVVVYFIGMSLIVRFFLTLIGAM